MSDSFCIGKSIRIKAAPWLACALFLLIFTANSAAANVDSLLKVEAGLPSDTSSIAQRLKIALLIRSTDPETSLEAVRRAHAIAESSKDPALLASTCNSLGGCFRVLNRYAEAIEALQQASAHFQAASNERGLAQVHLNMGSIQLTRQDYPSARHHLELSRDIVERKDIDAFKGTLYTNLSIIHIEEGHFQEALSLLDSCMKIFQADNDQRSVVLTLTNIGYTHYKMGEYEECLRHTSAAMQMASDLGLLYEKATAHLNNLEALAQLGRTAEAQKQLPDLEALVIQMESPQLLAQFHRMAADVHEGNGQHAKALSALRTYQRIQDSLDRADQDARVAELQATLQHTQDQGRISLMERERALRDQEDEARRTWTTTLWVGLFLAAAAAVLLVILLLYSHKQTALLRMGKVAEDRLRHRLEIQNEELRRNNDRLEDLNREKDALISVVAHDLRSPLNKTIGLSDLVARSGPLNADQQQAINMLLTVATQGKDLIRDLLDLTRIEHEDEQPQFDTLPMYGFLLEIVRSFQGAAEAKGIKIHMTCPENLTWQTHRPDLARILENLISNALKFSPKGKNIWLVAEQKDGEVTIAVRDEGPGISQADQAKLFKRFQRLSARPTGGESSTGLGLAIAKALVDKLRGQIKVDSQPGAGATFCLAFPGTSQATPHT